MKQVFANIVALLAVTHSATVNASRASIEARQRRLVSCTFETQSRRIAQRALRYSTVTSFVKYRKESNK